MNPTPSDPNALLANLRQLKEMLDAGALTPQEYDTLKQRLIGEAAGPTSGAAPIPSASGVATPASSVTPPPSVAEAPVAPTTPAAPTDLPAAAPAPVAGPPTPYLDTPTALTPEATPLLAPEPDWLAAPAPALFVAGEGEPDPGAAEVAERRNPLNLIFALGGLLLFLAVVAYLVYERRPDEHVTSQSQTAADSTATAPEVGPQAEQLTLPPVAAPETVRVAPATPPPTAVDNATAGMDSTAAMPAAVDPTRTPAPAGRPTPAARPAPTTPAAADTTRQ